MSGSALQVQVAVMAVRCDTPVGEQIVFLLFVVTDFELDLNFVDVGGPGGSGGAS